MEVEKKKKSTSESATQSHSRDGESRSPPERYHGQSPPLSPLSSNLSHQSSLSHGFSPEREEEPPAPPPGNDSPARVTTAYRSVREETKPVTMEEPGGRSEYSGSVAEEVVGSARRARPSLSILRRTKREMMAKKAALGFRVCGLIFCLISMSVMAADSHMGWALDSFHRYKEFRYCLSVNVIGFVYSGAQAYDLAYHLATGKYVRRHRLRYYFDFAVDQMLTYLLMSASSSAATRAYDWQSNWGRDKFPTMANASVGISFVAFVALAGSSLISGYALYSFRSF